MTGASEGFLEEMHKSECGGGEAAAASVWLNDLFLNDPSRRYLAGDAVLLILRCAVPAKWQKNRKGLGRAWLRCAEGAEGRRLHRVWQGSRVVHRDGMGWFGVA